MGQSKVDSTIAAEKKPAHRAIISPILRTPCGAELAPKQVEYVNAHGPSTVLNDPTGTMETAICALALQRGHLHGTGNMQQKDEDCDLDVIPPRGQTRHTAETAPYLRFVVERS